MQCTVAPQAPLSMDFSRQEYWSGLPFPSPGDCPNPGIEPGCPALQVSSLPSEPLGKPSWCSNQLVSGSKRGSYFPKSAVAAPSAFANMRWRGRRPGQSKGAKVSGAQHWEGGERHMSSGAESEANSGRWETSRVRSSVETGGLRSQCQETAEG